MSKEINLNQFTDAEKKKMLHIEYLIKQLALTMEISNTEIIRIVQESQISIEAQLVILFQLGIEFGIAIGKGNGTSTKESFT